MAMRMKDSGIEWIGEIPEDWEVRKLKYISSSMGGGTPSKDRAEFWNGDIPWVSPKDMKSEIIFTAEDMITVEGLEQSSTKMVLPGAVLIVVRSGILKHTIPVAINAVNVAMNQDMKAIVVDPAVMTNAFFMRWIQGLNDALLKEWVKLSATVDSIEQEYFANTCIAYPSITAQEKIIHFLDSRCVEIDTVIAAKQRQNDLLKEQRQSIIFEAVTKGLDPTVTYKDSGVEWIGEIPAGWERSRVKYRARVNGRIGFRGYTVDDLTVNSEEGALVLGGTNIDPNGKLNLLIKTFIINSKYEESPEIKLVGGEIIMTKVGAGLGQTAMIEDSIGRATINPNVMIIFCREIRNKYLHYYFLCAPVLQTIWLEGEKSGAQPAINQSFINNFPIVVPPHAVQNEIIDYLDIRCAELDRVVAANNAVIDKLKEYRQSLIYEAVTGKIAV